MDFWDEEFAETKRRKHNVDKLEQSKNRQKLQASLLGTVVVTGLLFLFLLHLTSSDGYAWGGWISAPIEIYLYSIPAVIALPALTGWLASAFDETILAKVHAGDAVPATSWWMLGIAIGVYIDFQLLQSGFFF
jgi:hypothetical protein